MDKNTIIGFALIALVLFGFTWYSQPSAEEQRAAFVKDSIENVARQTAEKNAKLIAQQKQREAQEKILDDTTALFHKALKGQNQNVVLHNDKLELTFSSKGATVTKAIIKNYIGHDIKVKDGSNDSPSVTLFDGADQQLDFTFATKTANISTQDLYFSPTQVTDSTVVFTAEAGPNQNITLSYKLGKNYMLHSQISVMGMEGLFDRNTNNLNVNWKDKIRQQERGFTFENRYATLTYHHADGGTD